MGEYEDRYPEAYGQSEAGASRPARRRPFLGIGFPRQMKGDLSADGRPHLAGAPHPGPLADPAHSDVPRTPRQICDDLWEQLKAEPSIDVSGITVSVSGTEVALDGTVNSPMAVSVAQTLAANIAGVSRVQVSLRVAPAAGSAA